MIVLAAALGAALVVALVAMLALVLWLPGHIARLVSAERARAWTALHKTTTAEIAPLVGSLRALVDWLAAFAAAQYAQAQQASARAAPTRPVAIAPPGSAVEMDPAPAMITAGLRPRPAAKPPAPIPASRAPGSSPTLVSVQAVPAPNAQPREGTS
jgi:hypothetical protein